MDEKKGYVLIKVTRSNAIYFLSVCQLIHSMLISSCSNLSNDCCKVALVTESEVISHLVRPQIHFYISIFTAVGKLWTNKSKHMLST